MSTKTPSLIARESIAATLVRTGTFVAVWMLLLVAGRSRLFRDPGTFWHTVVGERLLVSRQPIWTDTFTFTFAGKPWIAHQWLGEVLMALAHRLCGLDTLLVLTAAFVAGLLSWIAGRLIQSGLHWARAALVIALLLATMAGHLHVRPHLATMLGLAVVMAVLLDVESGRKSPEAMLWLVPFIWVWANIHGGVLGAFGTLGLAVLGWGVASIWRGGVLPQPPTLRLIYISLAAVVLCVGSVFINPYGWRLPYSWIQIVESPVLTRVIVEHRPLRLASPQGAMVAIMALVYLLMVSATWSRQRRIVWLLPLVWLALAISRVRHAPLFGLVAALVIADMLPFTPFGKIPAQGGAGGVSRWMRPLPLAVPAILVVGSLCTQLAGASVPLVGRGAAKLDASLWPVELLPELRAHQHDRDGGTPIFNEYLYGGFLIYFTPGYRVFVDDRCELYRSPEDAYTDQWLDKFVKAQASGTAEAMADWERRYGPFDQALVTTSPATEQEGFDAYFRQASEWRLVKRTETATMYRRMQRPSPP